MRLTYKDLVNKLTDLKALSLIPVEGERVYTATSYDRASRYDYETDTYINWDANNDGSGYIRKEGKNIVAMEADGPGVIWRIWSALPQEGNICIYIDGEEAVCCPFRDFFEKVFSEDIVPMNFPNLVPTLSRGRNSFIPIPFQKHCKIVFEENWGAYYHIIYSVYPEGTILPSISDMYSNSSMVALAEADRILSFKGNYPYEGNGDQIFTKTTTIPSKGEKTLFKVDENGAIKMLAMTIKNNNEKEIEKALKDLVISITWDNNKSPSVFAPLEGFFGTANGINEYRSYVMAIKGNTMYSYWYMPFEKADIQILNKSGIDYELSYEIRYEKIKNVDKLLRFHCKWHDGDFQYLDRKRFEKGGDRYPDWPLALIKGKGRFCGINLHVLNTWEEPENKADTWWYGAWDKKSIDWWWGEGDEKFFIDGEVFPSIFGTGSEDYIGYAWGAEPPFAIFESPYACQSNVPLDGNGHTSVNRFHICDNIPFNKSFEGFIEKYKEDIWGENNICKYDVAAYWYQML